jgi:fructoselysine-6-P-deglycase FrlB-like protein
LGKPFADELSQLPETYRWALKADVERLASAAAAAARFPLIAVGSGGSFTVAEFAASLHRELAGTPASAQTPLQTVASNVNLRTTALFMPTAGGSNPDVLGAFRRLGRREPGTFWVLCLTRGSALAKLAAKMPAVQFVEMDVPFGRDGFLATNSLLASVVLLARAYAAACDATLRFPVSIDELLSPADGTTKGRSLSDLWRKDTLVVLHDGATRTAALDLESKFTEAALGNVRAADYRQFAHGRHHWLAKRADTTAVLAFSTSVSDALASKTIALLPRSVPVLRLRLPFQGALSEVAALVHVLHIARSAGAARGIDPGRPGVPPFGRRIYHLNAFRGGTPTSQGDREQLAIERKVGRTFSDLPSDLRRFWKKAYATFVERIAATRFVGLALDYDGTLCGPENRYGDIAEDVCRELTKLVRAGIVIGLATGRGKSVRMALRRAVPERFWERVVVGYYNGGDIGLLSDDSHPDGSSLTASSLEPLATALVAHPLLSHLARLETRPPQITIYAKREGSLETIWAIVQHVVATAGVPGTTLLRSAHTMDILAPGADKRAVVRRVASLAGDEDCARVLCIGDRGRFPGNDFLLLGMPNALSVDEVSPDPSTCWNLAPVGYRCVAACSFYLRLLTASKGSMRVAAIDAWKHREG